MWLNASYISVFDTNYLWCLTSIKAIDRRTGSLMVYQMDTRLVRGYHCLFSFFFFFLQRNVLGNLDCIPFHRHIVVLRMLRGKLDFNGHSPLEFARYA